MCLPAPRWAQPIRPPASPIGALEMVESGIVRVIVGQRDPTLADRQAEEADSRLDPERPDPLLTTTILDPGVVGELEDAGRRVEEIGDRPVGPEKAGRL